MARALRSQAWLLAYNFLHDITVVDLTDPEPQVDGGLEVVVPSELMPNPLSPSAPVELVTGRGVRARPRGGS